MLTRVLWCVGVMASFSLRGTGEDVVGRTRIVATPDVELKDGENCFYTPVFGMAWRKVVSDIEGCGGTINQGALPKGICDIPTEASKLPAETYLCAGGPATRVELDALQGMVREKFGKSTDQLLPPPRSGHGGRVLCICCFNH